MQFNIMKHKYQWFQNESDVIANIFKPLLYFSMSNLIQTATLIIWEMSALSLRSDTGYPEWQFLRFPICLSKFWDEILIQVMTTSAWFQFFIPNHPMVYRCIFRVPYSGIK